MQQNKPRYFHTFPSNNVDTCNTPVEQVNSFEKQKKTIRPYYERECIVKRNGSRTEGVTNVTMVRIYIYLNVTKSEQKNSKLKKCWFVIYWVNPMCF